MLSKSADRMVPQGADHRIGQAVIKAPPHAVQHRHDYAHEPTERVRRVAAIAVMDMVAFCRLTAMNEDDTLTRWAELRTRVIGPTVDKHGGRVVRAVGDQVLLDHPSAPDALDCAVQLQRGLCAFNAQLAAGVRMDFRIGVHIGPVIDDGKDLFGATVNVAARLEALAHPGGIVISEAIRDGLGACGRHRLDDMGMLGLRNVPGEVRAFRWRPAA